MVPSIISRTRNVVGVKSLFVDNTVVKFCEFCIVPTVGGADKISGDALQTVDSGAVAMRAFFEVGRRVFISAYHTTVAIVVYRTVSNIVFIHQVNNIGNRFRIVSGISVDFDIEDMTGLL